MFSTRSVPPLPAKVGGSPVDWPEHGRVKAIVRVVREGHVPAGVTLRTRIDPLLFTAEFDAGDLARIADDPLVAAISAAEAVQALAAGPAAKPRQA